ncbi:hypothetical protein [Chryseobacterium sp. ERMR1:04]|uniref:MNIO class RiPP chryseobasin precursor ChrA n=1 Tax=Chryseobacterium sp. ERMR1:04 TaxID=1705393 RepID=UPI0006C8BA8B|nr:hypothetical protein [Chryseobacterium sp. ERMR1:04]KPH14048.1 hypothetical protein AMQ68_00530 [Chryseobacterium sp. ERMR1:04]
MKIPSLLMASLFAVGASAQTTKPTPKKAKKPVSKIKKDTVPKPIVKKDTIVKYSGHGCPACGMG